MQPIDRAKNSSLLRADSETSIKVTNQVAGRVFTKSTSQRFSLKVQAVSQPVLPMIEEISDDLLALKLAVRPKSEARVSKAPSGVFTPRQALKKHTQIQEHVLQEHIEKLLTLLKGEESSLTPYFNYFKALVEGVGNGDSTYIKSLENAASDLWRMCARCSIHRIESSERKSILDHKSNGALVTVEQSNAAFLALLNEFMLHQKIKQVLPDEVAWQKTEDVTKWINSVEITHDSPFARFIRSCSQERYSGEICHGLLLSNYGRLSEKPIMVKVDPSEMRATRIFYDTGCTTETIELPIFVLETATERSVSRISWIIQYFYDEESRLAKMQTRAFRMQ